ncbi:MAG: HlyC/CorC family transporter [Clostridia bacterium]|nr:HlyC/CorC family transporter [Clostridia bacterium]
MDELPSAGTIILRVLLVFILIFINGFFSMSEIALITLNDNKIDKLAGEGNKKAKKIADFTANSGKFLSTIQIGVTLAGFLASAFAADSFVGYILIGLKITDTHPHYRLISNLILIAITILMSYFTLVLGELVPKKIGMQKAEKVSFAVIDVLRFFGALFSPLVKILSVSANAVVRLLGMNPNADEETVTEEEILMMVDVGEEKGVIEEAQSEMVSNIFEFDDVTAGELMVHRTEIVAVEMEDSIEEVLTLACESGRSRIAVYEEDIDSIKGVIYVKDLIPYVGKNVPKSVTVKSLIRPALFVPESKKADDLFEDMCKSRIQIAVVVDEYGGTAGIITLEDLVESIVGDIQDEYDDEEADFEKVDEGIYNFEGDCDIEDAEDSLNISLPIDDYDTLAGFVLEQLGDIPDEGDSFEYKNLTFTVTEMDENKIEKIRVKVNEKEKEEE